MNKNEKVKNEEEQIGAKIFMSSFNDQITYSDNQFTVSGFSSSQFFKIINFIKSDLDKNKRILVKDNLIKKGNDLPLSITDLIDISHCTFEKDFILQNCIIPREFTAKHSEFLGNTSFKKSVFENKTRFHNSKFETSINFENTTFESLIDFYEANFHNPQRFFLTDFLDVAIFSNVTFHKQVQFVYNKVENDSIISFENAHCKQAIDISRSNLWCKLQFWGIRIDKNIPEDIWLYESDKIEKKAFTKFENALPRIRESYRMIKHVFRQEGNNIDALKFHQKELFVFKAEDKIKLGFKSLQQIKNIRLQEFWSKIAKFSKKVETYITIRFNYYSNNFGQSWSRGILFTLMMTLLFFTIFLNCSDKVFVFELQSDTILLTIKYFLQFLNITKWDYCPFGIDMEAGYSLGYVILFIGRIFISYGYYQTIQAFRKFGKN